MNRNVNNNRNLYLALLAGLFVFFVSVVAMFVNNRTANFLPVRFVSSEEADPIAVFRFWSPTFKSHFYTLSNTEKDKLIDQDPNWAYEKIAFFAYQPKFCVTGTSPVYRFWSPVFQSHFYTIDKQERDKIIANDSNWQYEKVVFCTFANKSTFTSNQLIAVYRFWSPVFQSHFYTTSRVERDKLVYQDPNWHYEGIAFYAINTELPSDTIFTTQ